MDEADIRLFTVTHKKKTTVYSETAMKMAEEELSAEQYAQLIAKGQWREIWLKEAMGTHEEEINRRCLVKDERMGMRFDPAKEPAARLEVMVEKWNGFLEKPSMQAYATVPLLLLKRIDEFIVAHMYPSGLDADFFTP